MKLGIKGAVISVSQEGVTTKGNEYLLLAGEVLLVIIGLYFIINGYRESHEETSFSETSAARRR